LRQYSQAHLQWAQPTPCKPRLGHVQGLPGVKGHNSLFPYVRLPGLAQPSVKNNAARKKIGLVPVQVVVFCTRCSRCKDRLGQPPKVRQLQCIILRATHIHGLCTREKREEQARCRTDRESKVVLDFIPTRARIFRGCCWPSLLRPSCSGFVLACAVPR
jgi:hypothetical protein